MPKVSIIIPVLNSIKYIKECVDSVAKQTLRDLEIILVDGGSEDGTLELLKEYAAGDTRIKLLYSNVKSMGYQYNLGLDSATGEYIGFVESDDYAEPNMFLNLYELARQTSVDWVKANFNLFADLETGERIFIKEERFRGSETKLYGKVINPLEYPEILLGEAYMWQGIYNRKWIKQQNIRLNTTLGASFQDFGFVMQAAFYGRKVMYVEETYYNYRRDNSESSVYKQEAFNFSVREAKYVTNILSNYSYKYRFEACFYTKQFRDAIIHYRRLADLNELGEETLSNINTFVSMIREAYESNNILLRYRDCQLTLLLTNFKAFDFYIRVREEHKKRTLKQLINNVNCYERVLILENGIVGRNLTCFLKICGLFYKVEDVIDYSDKSNFNNKLYKISEENKLYLIADADEYGRRGIKQKLLQSGISDCDIFYSPELDGYEATDFLLIRELL